MAAPSPSVATRARNPARGSAAAETAPAQKEPEAGRKPGAGVFPFLPQLIPADPGGDNSPRLLPLQRKLAVGASNDPLEAEADRVAAQLMRAPVASRPLPAPALRRKGASEPGAVAAPPIVHRVLASPGQPLDAATRGYMEPRFQVDLSRVRVHTGALAAESARAVNALAYTVGKDLVFASGQYQPCSGSGRMLLAHELAHVAQQSSAPMPWIQRQGATGTTPKPRTDYVFIMGEDPANTGNPFYGAATEYFKAHLPSATFVNDQRSLAEMLSWISSHVKDPIGNLYIVSHGNEDGTLGFGLDAGDTTHHMTVNRLRDALHPSGGGATALPSVASLVDAQTRIHIKGCDIGRTKEMVELIDEAFGGAGTVTAPTHEQKYTTDKDIGKDARKAAHDQDIANFTSKLPPLPPQPPPVDRKLKGDALKKSQKEHDDAVAALKAANEARTKAIADEEKRLQPELDEVEKKAKTIDVLSGPMFQRPGNKLFTAAELKPEIDRLYPHLSDKQRESLGKQLVAPDHGTADDQQGQKVDKSPVASETFNDPQNLKEGIALYGKGMKDGGFVPDGMTATQKTDKSGATIEVTFTGTFHPKDAPEFDGKWTGISIPVPDSDKLLAQAKKLVNNPDRYQWQVERKHDRSGTTTLNAFGERVKAYLHHGSLDAGPHDHFSQPESSSDFYYTSTFAPPPPPGASTSSGPGASGASAGSGATKP